MTWDEEALRRRFEFSAQGHEQYAKKSRALAKTQPAYEYQHDTHQAEWFIEYRLAGNDCLVSREATLAELNYLKANMPKPTFAYNVEQYGRAWQMCLDQLIDEFSK